MSKYQIGQYRKVVSSSLNGDVKDMTKSEQTFEGFSEVVFDLGKDSTNSNKQFVKDSDYQISIEVPQSTAYDMDFIVRLIKSSDTTASTYQNIGKLSVPMYVDTEQANSAGLKRVVLYQDPNSSEENIKVAIAEPMPSNVDDNNQNLYYEADSSSGSRYVYKLGKNTVVTLYNDVDLSVTWVQDDADVKDLPVLHFDFVFSPIDSGFDRVLLKMERKTDDHNIMSSDGTIGRKAGDVKCTYTELTSILDSGIGQKTLSKIGAWGRTGLILCINHELIRIGRSGYFEYDTMPITSLGAIAGDGDYLTIDYTYPID